MKKAFLFIIIAFIFCRASVAQVNDPNQVAKDATTNQANNDMNSAANNGVNKTENSVKGLFKKKKKDENPTTAQTLQRLKQTVIPDPKMEPSKNTETMTLCQAIKLFFSHSWKTSETEKSLHSLC